MFPIRLRKMAHRGNFEKKTKTFFGQNRFEQRIKSLIELLLAERNELKVQIAELHAKQQALESQIEASQTQTQATQQICRETQKLIGGVLEMTRNLAEMLPDPVYGTVSQADSM